MPTISFHQKTMQRRLLTSITNKDEKPAEAVVIVVVLHHHVIHCPISKLDDCTLVHPHALSTG